jgi:hypothetical protein
VAYRIVKIIEAESRMVDGRAKGRNKAEFVFNGCRVLVLPGEKSSGDGDGVGCPATQMP